MGKERYDLLMGEIDKIAVKVKLFPEHMQGDVFSALLSALTGGRETVLPNGVSSANEFTTAETADKESATHDTAAEDWKATDEIARLVELHKLEGISSIDFATLVAYVHTVIAPDHAKLDVINVSDFEEACVEMGREFGNSSAALDNAKKDKYKYLQGGKRNGYTLTNQGKIHIKNKLPT